MQLHDQKLESIITLLKEEPYWTSKDIAEKLKISRSTVQKCLQELHEENIVQRVHGGAKRKDHNYSTPISMADRIDVDKLPKKAICKEAVKLLGRGGYVYIDGGTTTLPMAGMIGSFRGESGLVVVTNDPAIASELARFGKKHILLGGQIHQVTQTISGSISQMQIMSYRFDMCFISADAISEDGKVTGAIADESTLKKQAILQSQQKILVATARKWGKSSGTMIADLKEFDTWITEKCPQTAAQLCEKLSVKVINSYKK